VLESKDLDSFDPRIQRLSDQIEDARAKSAGEPAVSPSTAPNLSKEYAFLQATSLPTTGPSLEKTQALDSLAAQSLASSAALPSFVAPATSAEPVHPSPEETGMNPQTQSAAMEIKQIALTASAPASIVLPTPVKTWPAAKPAAVPSRLMPVALTILALVILSAVWIGLRLRQPSKPGVDPLETQQRQSMEAANARIAANDLDGALRILQQAQGLKGPLTTEIQEKLSEVEKSKGDADLRELRAKEEQLWGTVKGLVEGGRYTEAQQALENILALPPGGVHRSDAQQYLDRTIPQLQAQKYLAQGDFQSARRAADVVKQKGGNPAELVTKIDQAEQRELNQLKNQFAQVKLRGDNQAIQQLKELQAKFQTLAGDGGPQSREAQSYADSIPGAIADVQARAGKNSASKKSAGAQCEALKERMLLGETLSEEERAFLKDKCP
jgi:hypothetical protein